MSPKKIESIKRRFEQIIVRGNIFSKNIKPNPRPYFRGTFTSFAKKRKRIQNRLNRGQSNKKKLLRKRRNLIPYSYFKRFVLAKKQRRRFFFKKGKEREASLLNTLRLRFKKQEIRKRFLSAKKIPRNYRELSKRYYILGTLYLTYHRRNLFANVMWANSSAKASCGEYYRGPKKKTMHAREQVMRNIADVIGQKRISTLDIYIVPFGRVYKHLCKIFLRINDIYVRYLFTPRKRSHGFTRPRKKRR